MKKGGHCHQILQILQTRDTLTAHECIVDYGIFNLAARISDLVHKYDIKVYIHKKPNKLQGKHSIYSLNPFKNEVING